MKLLKLKIILHFKEEKIAYILKKYYMHVFILILLNT